MDQCWRYREPSDVLSDLIVLISADHEATSVSAASVPTKFLVKHCCLFITSTIVWLFFIYAL